MCWEWRKVRKCVCVGSRGRYVCACVESLGLQLIAVNIPVVSIYSQEVES